MDVDWCLTCEKRLHTQNLYCSSYCRYLAASSSTSEGDHLHSLHSTSSPTLDTTTTIAPSRWMGNDHAGISAWAAEIPYGAPADPSISYTSHSAYRPTQLLSRHSKIVPPSLCTNTPQAITPPPSIPLRTAKPHPTIQPCYTSQTSLKSALSDSPLATPASAHPMPISTIQQHHQHLPLLNHGAVYSHLRSWVTPSPSFVPFKRATSPNKVKPLNLTISARNTNVKVVSPPDTPLGFLDEDTVHWKSSTILLEQPRLKHVPQHQPLRACHPSLADQDSSFRARGRKASRAVA